MMDPILRIRNLEKVFPGGHRALDNVTLDVYPGEFLIIIGLSGSGKSTLLRCINRLVEPGGGSIIFDGRNVTTAGKSELTRIRRRIGMIFQQFNLVNRSTVLTNVLAGRLGFLPAWRSLTGLIPAEETARALKYLEKTGISDKAHDRAGNLSGGQQQRVAISRALMQEPDLFLADEPVASLDPATSDSVMRHLAALNREGITVLCSLHFLSLARKYGSRVVALKDGAVVYDGPPEKIDDAWFGKIYGEDAEAVEIH